MSNFRMKSSYVCFFKIATCVIMLITAVLMVYDYLVDPEVMPNYFNFTSYDFVGWVLILLLMSITQISLLLHIGSAKCRLMGDLLLQLSGFTLLVIGWAFVNKYPPFSSLMVMYPLWGLAALLIGRFESKFNRRPCYLEKAKNK